MPSSTTTSAPSSSCASCGCSEAVQRPADLEERLARIEEKMATRDDLSELRARLEKRGPPGMRWAAGAVFGAAITVGFPILIFTR